MSEVSSLGRRRIRSGLAVAASLSCALSPAAAQASGPVSSKPLALASSIGPARSAATPADAAATETYLSALYAYDQAILASAARSSAAVKGFASRVAAECPGALDGAPPTDANTARGIGESIRQSGQLRELEAEVTVAVSSAASSAYSEAANAFAGATAGLRWGNAALTGLVHGHALALQEWLHAPTLDVCADIHAWVASGYRTLSPATKAGLAAQESLSARTQAETRGRSIEKLLAALENASARALVAHIEALSSRLDTDVLEATQTAEQRVDTALGIHSEFPGPESTKPPVVIGHGRTAAGGRFTVAVASGPPQQGCKFAIAIDRPEESRASSLSGGLALSVGGECLSRPYEGANASVNCNSGVLTITADTRPAARSVWLLLSDGARITSRVIRVPRRGGRVGFYYQEVRGPSPIPVSLTELDASGRTIDVVRLPAIVECTKHPLQYLPGGRPRTLVNVQAPNGPLFAILAERYRFLGRVHFQLKLRRTSTEREELEGGFSLGESSIVVFRAQTKPPAFLLEESTGCRPHAYDVVWGLLKPPGATVLVRVGGVLTPLPEHAIPSQLHAGGTLVYGAFSSPPTEVIVREASGRTRSRESLAELARQTNERCEGETEPGGGPELAGTGVEPLEIVVGDFS